MSRNQSLHNFYVPEVKHCKNLNIIFRKSCCSGQDIMQVVCIATIQHRSPGLLRGNSILSQWVVLGYFSAVHDQRS